MIHYFIFIGIFKSIFRYFYLEDLFEFLGIYYCCCCCSCFFVPVSVKLIWCIGINRGSLRSFIMRDFRGHGLVQTHTQLIGIDFTLFLMIRYEGRVSVEILSCRVHCPNLVKNLRFEIKNVLFQIHEQWRFI